MKIKYLDNFPRKFYSLPLVLFLMAIFPFGVSALAPVVIFEDSFENTPQFSNPLWSADPQWGVSSSFAQSGSKKAFVQGNTNQPSHRNDDALKRLQPTTDFENITISYWYKTAGGLEQNDNDRISVEWTSDGVNWQNLFTVNHTNDVDHWTQKTHSLGSEASNNPNFALRFVAKLDSGNDKFYLDGLKIEGTPKPPEPRTARVVAQKIVCNSEADLPNWGDGEPVFSINENTATDFVTQSEGNCRLANWEFEWAPDGTSNPGDNVVSGGNGWTSFSGSVKLLPESRIWFREKVDPLYLGFSQDTNGEDGWDDVSTEFYCHEDVLNYDNYEWIDNMVAGQTYYCVAFNVTKEVPQVCDPKINLVANGSFEEPMVNNPVLWDVFPTVLGWNIDWMNQGEAPSPSLELHRGVNGWFPVGSDQGEQYAELDGDWYGPSDPGQGGLTKIFQDIQTISGKNYELKFSFSARPNTTDADNVLGVLWGGTEISGSPFISSNETNQTVWLENTLTLTGDGSLKRLQFDGRGIENSLGIFLDNVSLTCQNVQEDPEEPNKLQVKIYKYVDGVQATSGSVGNYEFPMEATWSWPTSKALSGNSGTGNYVLGLSGHGGSGPYQAYTSVMNAPASYQTHEITRDINSESKVLPVSARCEEGKYRLLGYRIGDDLDTAKTATLVSANPIFTNLNADKYVIVENEKCLADQPIQCQEGYHIVENECVKDEEENPQTPSDLESTQIPGGRRRDISSLTGGGGQVLGASTEDTNPMCEPYLNSYIKFGANNDPEEVKKLQIFLNQFFEVDNPVTGFYGPITFEMVKKFQIHQKAAILEPWINAGFEMGEPTGYVYKTTKRWINILKCPELIKNTPIPELP